MTRPGALFRSLAVALRLGGTDLGLAVKSCFQLVEGIIVWHHCRERGVTAVHAHFGQAPASVALLASTFGNFVEPDTWSWSMTVHGWHDFATEDTSRLRHKVAHAGLVVCISDFTRAQLMRLSRPADWHKIQIVRCGIDLQRFPRREIGPPVGEPAVVVTTGRLAAEKGHTVLIESRRCCAVEAWSCPRCSSATARRGRTCNERPKRGGLPTSSSSPGRCSRPRCQAGSHERTSSACPRSPKDSRSRSWRRWQSGVPVVTTYIAGTPELVVDGVTGWIVPAGNAERLADALVEVITSDGPDSVVDAARQAVERFHDGATNIVELERLLTACHERRTSSE